MNLFGKTDTQELSTRQYILANEHRYRGWLFLMILLMVLGASAYAGIQYFEAQLAPARRVSVLELENADLRKSLDDTQSNLEATQIKFEMARATRAGLEKQVEELSQEVTRLKEELNFFRKTQKKP